MSKPDFENAVRRIRNTALPFTAAVNVCKGIFEQGEIAGAGDRAALLAEIDKLHQILLEIMRERDALLAVEGRVVKSLRTWREAKRLSWLGRWDGMHPDRLWERVEEAHDAALRETEPAPGGEGTNG